MGKKHGKAKDNPSGGGIAVPVPQRRVHYTASDYSLGGYGPAKAHHRKKAIIRADGEDDYTVNYGLPKRRSQGMNDQGGQVMDRVIASGAVEAGVFVLGAAASAWFVATRKSDLYWALGLGAASFFVAGGARNNAAVRDVSLGVLSGSAAVATLRAVGKLTLSSGQQ